MPQSRAVASARRRDTCSVPRVPRTLLDRRPADEMYSSAEWTADTNERWNTIAGRRYSTGRDARQRRGKAFVAAAGGKGERDARGRGMKGATTTSRRHTAELEATMAVRLLAPRSLPTRLPARMPQELAYPVRGVLPYAAILQSAPPEEHYSLCARDFARSGRRKQRLRRLFTRYFA